MGRPKPSTESFGAAIAQGFSSPRSQLQLQKGLLRLTQSKTTWGVSGTGVRLDREGW